MDNEEEAFLKDLKEKPEIFEEHVLEYFKKHPDAKISANDALISAHEYIAGEIAKQRLLDCTPTLRQREESNMNCLLADEQENCQNSTSLIVECKKDLQYWAD